MSDEVSNEWWEEEGEDWWDALGIRPTPGGTPQPVPSPTPSPDPVIRSDFSITTWGDSGSMGLTYKPSEARGFDVVFEATKQFHQADELVCLLRYHAPTQNISSWVQNSELLLYGSVDNLKLSDLYSLTPVNELYFNMLRAYERAKENNFEQAEILWNEIGESQLDAADDYRQPYILFHLYVTNMCISDWSKAIDYLERLWALIKFMDPNKRHATGAWDEWVACTLVNWIFLKACPEYHDEFCKDFVGQTRLFQFQKKIIILEHINDSFLSALIDESYYNRARELNPELPELKYKEKPSANL